MLTPRMQMLDRSAFQIESNKVDERITLRDRLIMVDEFDISAYREMDAFPLA